MEKNNENTHTYRRAKTAIVFSFVLPARDSCGVFKGASMRMMKCHLANTDADILSPLTKLQPANRDL